MDPNGFTRLARLLSAAGTRRGLLRLGGALPLVGCLVALRNEAGEARPRRKRKRKRGRGRVVVCHSGETLSVPRHAVHAILLDGGTRGPCGLGAGAPCIPDTADLQAAINAVGPSGNVILCAGTWTLQKTLTIDKNVALLGAGAGSSILSGGGKERVLEVDDAPTVTLRDLTISNGMTVTDGGGINNQGILTLIDVVVAGNSAGELGGGIFNGGILTLVGSTTIENNTAGDGGGIYHEFTQVEVFGGVAITRNTAARSGGGILNSAGQVTLKDGAFVTANSARFGGGIELDDDATLEVEAGVLITDNTAVIRGGGIDSILGNTVTLAADDIVTGNTLADGSTSNCAPANTIPNCIE
jgi:hypothetical protein